MEISRPEAAFRVFVRESSLSRTSREGGSRPEPPYHEIDAARTFKAEVSGSARRFMEEPRVVVLKR